jgi:hypothetical protein
MMNSFAALASSEEEEEGSGSEDDDRPPSSSGTEGELPSAQPAADSFRGPRAALARQPRFDFNARTRLMRDAREIMECPSAMPNISAAPTDASIFEWKVTLTAPDGRYHAVIFHAEMTFPDNYPDAPPVVRLCTDLPHPNIFAGYDYNQHRRGKVSWASFSLL